MIVLTALAVGSLIGWLSRMLAIGPPGLGMMSSILTGAMGGLLSAWLLTPLLSLNPATHDNFSMVAVALAVGGAMTLLGIVDLVRRVSAR